MSVTVKASLLMLVFFGLDFSVITHFALDVEFLLLGVIFLSLNIPYRKAMVVSIVFGIIKDSLIFNFLPISTFIFAALVFLIHYSFKYLKDIDNFLPKLFIVLASTVLYILVNSLIMKEFFPWFSAKFIFQSIIIFFLFNISLRKWIQG